MSISIPGRVVVFDYGEVISKAPSEYDRTELATIAELDPTKLWPAYWHHRDALDIGVLTAREYWRAIEKDTASVWDLATIYRLWLTDFRSWLTIEEETLALMAELRSGGTRMAMLSNAGVDFASYYRDGVLGDFFEKVFISGEIGRIKPGRDVFDLALAELNIVPSQMVFIDNKESNVRGAEALGILGHTFTTADELRPFLLSLSV